MFSGIAIFSLVLTLLMYFYTRNKIFSAFGSAIFTTFILMFVFSSHIDGTNIEILKTTLFIFLLSLSASAIILFVVSMFRKAEKSSGNNGENT